MTRIQWVLLVIFVLAAVFIVLISALNEANRREKAALDAQIESNRRKLYLNNIKVPKGGKK